MAKQDTSNLLAGLLVLAIVVSVAGIALNLALIKSVQVPGVALTGFAASNNQTGVVNFTQAGAAGITLIDDAVEYGAGFYNSSCGNDGIAYSNLNSLAPLRAGAASAAPSPTCWVNTTTDFPRNFADINSSGVDRHTIENNGTTLLNLTMLSDKNAADFVCGIGATCSSENASVYVLAEDNESSSCTSSLQSTFELLSDNNAGVTGNRTVGLCDSFGFQDSADTVNVYFNVSVPFDIPAGIKTMTVTYTGISL